MSVLITVIKTKTKLWNTNNCATILITAIISGFFQTKIETKIETKTAHILVDIQAFLNLHS